MTRIILDPAMLAKLQGLAGSVELCNASGDVVGFFLPANSNEVILRDDIEPWISAEESDRLFKEKGGRTLSEIMRRLEAL